MHPVHGITVGAGGANRRRWASEGSIFAFAGWISTWWPRGSAPGSILLHRLSSMSTPKSHRPRRWSTASLFTISSLPPPPPPITHCLRGSPALCLPHFYSKTSFQSKIGYFTRLLSQLKLSPTVQPVLLILLLSSHCLFSSYSPALSKLP
jgi:hypothetical protein